MQQEEIDFWDAVAQAIANTLAAQFDQPVTISWGFDESTPELVAFFLFCGDLAVEDDKLSTLIAWRHDAMTNLPTFNHAALHVFGGALRQYRSQSQMAT